jgi:hypothetical protein
MKKFLVIPLAAGLLLAGCGKKASERTTQAVNAVSNVVDAPLNYVGAVVQAQKHAENVIDVSYINQDIQMFNASEGRYPTNLEELIPNYLGRMPEVPFGYKLVYDTNTYTVNAVPK